VKPQVLVGVQVKAWPATLTDRPAGSLNITNVSGTLTYYPRSSSNFFVEGGAGGSFLKVTADDADPSPPELGMGFGLTARAGYEIHLGRGISLTPAVGFWYGRPGDLRIAGETFLKNWRHNVIDFTLAIKFN
jgi:hypothetical protein